MLILDIETIPQPREILESRMPRDIREPEMPLELREPEQPDFAAKAPEYSIPELAKKLEAARVAETASGEEADRLAMEAEKFRASEGKEADKAKAAAEKARKANGTAIEKRTKAEGALAEAEAKRVKWIEENRAKWQRSIAVAVEAWQLKTREAKWRFIQDAALDARLGHVKLIGLRNTHEGWSRVFIWEPDKTRIGAVRGWVRSLPEIDGDRIYEGRALRISEYMAEGKMLAEFFAFLAMQMDPTGEIEAGSRMAAYTEEIAPDLITYYGNKFDLPFMVQRSWITGHAMKTPFFFANRFDRRLVDLDDVWKMGARDIKTGGLETMAQSLGYPGFKGHDAGSFFEWYEKDPAEGVVYLLQDLDKTEFCAERTGVCPARQFKNGA